MRSRVYGFFILFTAYCLLFTVYCFAQETPPPPVNTEDQKIEERIENIAQTADEGADFTEIAENLKYFSAHPINLNNTTREELLELGLLNDIQVENLFSHIEKNGNLLSPEELQTIDGFDRETIYAILPYIRVSETYELNKESFGKIFKDGKHFLMLRTQRILETQKGFLTPEDSTASHYLGNPWKYYARYRFTFEKKISVGVTAEKDPGEEFFSGTQSSFDFYSAHLFVKDVGPVKAFAIGDYQLEYGQGLALWTGLAFGKTSEVLNVKKNAPGILPYTSVIESGFRRGAAVSLGYKKFSFDIFYSNIKFDGNVTDTTDLGEALLVSSLQVSGYHRTVSEVADKRSVSEKMFGGHAAYKSNSLSIGATVYHAKLSSTLATSFELYNQFNFRGDSATGASVDYSYLWRNISFFGEAARSNNGGMAYLNGALIALDPKVSVCLLHRNYERNYFSAAWNPFRESSASNERGFYSGITLKPLNTLTLATSFDAFTFPWLRYQVNAPSSGYEFMSQLTYTPNKKVSMYARYKQTTKSENAGGNLTPVDYLVDKTQRNYRFDTRVKVSQSFTLHNRVEFVKLQKESADPETGYLILQDVNYSPLGSPFSFNLRYALFDTQSFDSRIYAYESDLLYVYSIPFYYNRGSRFYAMVQYKVRKGIDIWLRYAQTLYSDINVISSGLDEIEGNTKSDVKIQVRFEF
jgi:hypothetical protein